MKSHLWLLLFFCVHAVPSLALAGDHLATITWESSEMSTGIYISDTEITVDEFILDFSSTGNYVSVNGVMKGVYNPINCSGTGHFRGNSFIVGLNCGTSVVQLTIALDSLNGSVSISNHDGHIDWREITLKELQ